MSFPDYIPVREVTVGGAAVIESGAPLSIRVKITSSRSLIWEATGYRFEALGDEATSAVGEQVTFTLPRTDVSGWRDARTGAIIDVSADDAYTHNYLAQLQFLNENNRVVGPSYSIGPFVLPEGDGPVDLDTLVPTSTVAGGQVLVPDSWGAIVRDAQAAAEAAAAALLDSEQFVADQVAGPGTLARARLEEDFAAAGDVAQLQELVDAGRLSDAALSSKIARRVLTVDALPSPCFMGHSGAQSLYGQFSREGIDAVVRSGFLWDCDLIQLADTPETGDFAVSHDADLSIATSESGSAHDLTLDQWRRVRRNPALPGGRPGSAATFLDTIARYASRVPGAIEWKENAPVQTSRPIALDMLRDRGLTRQLIVQSFIWHHCTEAASRGFSAMYFGTDKTPADLVAAGVEWIGVVKTVTDETVTAFKDAGIKVARYTLLTRAEVLADTSRDKIDMFICDDPWECSGHVQAPNRLDFSDGVGWPGLRINGTPAANMERRIDTRGWFDFRYQSTHATPIGMVLFANRRPKGILRVTGQFRPGASDDARYVTLWAANVPNGSAFYTNLGLSTLSAIQAVVRRNGTRQIVKRTPGSVTETGVTTAVSGPAYTADTSSESDTFTLELEVTDTAAELRDLTNGWMITGSETAVDRTLEATWGIGVANTSFRIIEASFTET